MKALLALALIACGPGPTHKYMFKYDVPDEEKEWIRQAVDEANKRFGCTALQVGEASEFQDLDGVRVISVAVTPDEVAALHGAYGDCDLNGDENDGDLQMHDYSQEQVITYGHNWSQIGAQMLALHEMGHGLTRDWHHSGDEHDIMFAHANIYAPTDTTYDHYTKWVKDRVNPCE